MKGTIVYKGKYGATQQYAIWLGAALNLQVLKPGYAQPQIIANADYILIGTSVYIGKLRIAAWLKKNAAMLKGKKLVFFIVAGTPLHETDKLNAYFVQGVPEELREGASCYFLPGSLRYQRLSLKDKILLRAGARLANLKGERMEVKDYNDVSREKLAPILKEVSSFSANPTLT